MAFTTEYFSGQGRVLIAERDKVTGAALGFREVGNVPELTMGVESSTYEHKESYSGTRSVDLSILTELSAKLSMTLESLDPDNLALALWGSKSAVAGGSVLVGAPESVVARVGLITPLAHPNVSNVVVKDATNTTTYVAGTDYEIVDAGAGSIRVLATGNIDDEDVLHVSYTYGGYSDVKTMNQGAAPVRWLRFEGLNTVDGKAVIVDVYKVSILPLQELSLITDEVAGMKVDMQVLRDSLRGSTDQFFRILKI